MEYYEGINQGDWYLCDRCEVTKLRYDEYENNIRDEYKYCDECWTYMHIQEYKDKKGNIYKLRSERKIQWQELLKE